MLGYVFVKLRQPKVVDEILAGVVLGPALVGRLPFASGLMEATKREANILNFVYWLGLLLLMFLSGAEAQQLFSREDRRAVGWLTIVGKGIPFILALGLGPWVIRPALAGPNGNRISLIIIIAVGVAVTSVPVVSKIFADLRSSIAVAHTALRPFQHRNDWRCLLSLSVFPVTRERVPGNYEQVDVLLPD